MSSRGDSSRPIVTDAPEEARFGVLHREDFAALSNFRIDYLYEVKAGPESGFICEVQIHNPSDSKGGYCG